MSRVIKVKFRSSGKVYYFDALNFDIHDGDGVIVETNRGNMIGDAVGTPEETPEERLFAPLKPVLRIASSEDMKTLAKFRAKEREAEEICRKKIEEHRLDMKLVDVEYTFDGSKLTFYFTADNRVDFRELLKDLTAVFKTKIDLRQIGERDEAKKCGGLGFCGRPICCSTFLNEFTPVSIKLAKSQNLSLNPLKISGICGKLMCCLRYEQENYESMQKLMPKVGKEFKTPDGIGVVLENNIISETTKLKITLSDGTFDVRSYPFRELVPSGGCAGCGGDCKGHIEEPDDEASDDFDQTDDSFDAEAFINTQEFVDAEDGELSGDAPEKAHHDKRFHSHHANARPDRQDNNGDEPKQGRFKTQRQHRSGGHHRRRDARPTQQKSNDAGADGAHDGSSNS